MAIVSPYLSIITLNVNRLNTKDKEWLSALKKNKTQQYAACKKLTLVLMKHMS